MKLFKLSYLLLLLPSCVPLSISKGEGETKNNSSITPTIENDPPLLSDSERQKDITDPDLKDNFSFDQFKSVNWSDTKTFGTPGSYAKKTNNPMPEKLEQKNFGITKDNYEVIDIKGDGSCFMRASFNAVLHRAFNNQSIFDEVIKNIPIVAKKYENIPGFSQRFRAKDLITLLTTLNNLSESEQLKALNTDKVDTFLNYSFRSLFAARKNSNKDIKELLDVNEWGDVRRAMFDFQEMLVPQHNLALLFPQKGLEDQFFIKIPGENKKIEFTKDYRKKFIELYDQNIDSKKLEEDDKKAKEEINKAPNEQKTAIANKHANIFEQNKHLGIIKNIEVFKEKGAKKLEDFYKLEEMSILPYRTAGGNHVQILIRKEQKSKKNKILT